MLLLFVWNNNTRGKIYITSPILDQSKRKVRKSSKICSSNLQFWTYWREKQEKAPKSAHPSPYFGSIKEKSKKKLQNPPTQAPILDQEKRKARKSSKPCPPIPHFGPTKVKKQEKAPNPPTQSHNPNQPEKKGGIHAAHIFPWLTVHLLILIIVDKTTPKGKRWL